MLSSFFSGSSTFVCTVSLIFSSWDGICTKVSVSSKIFSAFSSGFGPTGSEGLGLG